MAVCALIAGTAGADPAGDIVDAHIKAIGGMDNIRKIKSIHRKGDAALSGMMGEMAGTTEQIVIPGKKAYQMFDLGMFMQKSGYNGETAWSDNSMQGITKLEGEEASQIKSQTELDILVAIKNDPKSGKLEVLPDENVGEAAHAVLQFTGEGSSTPIKVYVNKETNLITQMSLKQNNPQMGEITIVMGEADHADFDGVKLPKKTSIKMGEDMINIVYTYTETKLNGEVDDKVFEMPTPPAAPAAPAPPAPTAPPSQN
jgi:outer membrane lipoprotein-sorting protein